MTREHDHPLPRSRESVHGTFGSERTVLVIARTITSTARLLEALRYFRDDPRIDVVFTVNDTSPHSCGARALLERARADRIVDFGDVSRIPFALAISASENVDFGEFTGRTVVLPHGIGFNKYVPDPGSGGTRLAGLPPADALRSGRVLLTLAHPSQQHQLRAVCPEVRGNTAVVGDPTYDQLRESLPLRDRYRREFGLGGRKLVLVTSTWWRESLLGRHRELIERLLAALPADEYAVALCIHPNVWSDYGDLRMRELFDAAADAGLLLLPPERGWQAALVAAHQVLGDHGSVSLYAAAIGKPLLLAAFGAESVPGTPIEALGRTADHLDPDGDLPAQLRRSRDEHDPERFAPLAQEVFARTGDSARLVREVLYGELGLSAPEADPPLLRPDDARPYRHEVTSFEVFTEFTEPGTVRMWRYPAAVRRAAAAADHPRPDSPRAVRHLAVHEDEKHLRRQQSAAVLVRGATSDEDSALEWAGRMHREYPGVRLAVAATEDGCVARFRTGPPVRGEARAEPMLIADALHAILRSGREEGRFAVSCGVCEFSLTVTALDG